MRKTLLGTSVLALSIGCKPPPQAPDRLEELCAYVFHHMGDDVDEDGRMLEFEAGIENLDAWLEKGDNLASTTEGYQITALEDEAVDALDLDSARGTDELIGAAVAIRHGYGSKRIAYATVVADWAEVVPKNYKEYERDFDRGPGCFTDRECTELEASAYGLSSWAGLVDVETWNDIQFRWVETDIGWVVAHRSWLVEPAIVSWDGIDVFAQYFLAVTLPAGEGKTTRVMATWIDSDYGALPVSEDFAKSQIVTSMQNQGEAVNDFLAD